MGLVWQPMTPGEVVPREINWAGQLNGDVISTSSLTVEHGTLTLAGVSHDNEIVYATVSGGLHSETVILLNTITTGDGRTLQQVITMVVMDAVADDLPKLPSTATKLTIIQMAFEVAGLAGYIFNATPEEVISALRKLDGMMASWDTQGIDLHYNFPITFGQGDPDETSGIPDFAIETAAAALALRIAPGIGKTMSAEARASLNSGMIQLRTATAVIPERELQRKTPRGAGSKPWGTWQPFIGDAS